MNVKEIVEILKLKELPLEGGMYRETYKLEVNDNEDPLATAIYYLLDTNSFSHMHRLPYDEIYHFYLGDSIEILELLPDGTFKTTILGKNIDKGEKLQYLAPAGVWQGSRLVEGGEFALLGTTMTPGFTDSIYEQGAREYLVNKYPEAEALIVERTNEDI